MLVLKLKWVLFGKKQDLEEAQIRRGHESPTTPIEIYTDWFLDSLVTSPPRVEVHINRETVIGDPSKEDCVLRQNSSPSFWSADVPTDAGANCTCSGSESGYVCLWGAKVQVQVDVLCCARYCQNTASQGARYYHINALRFHSTDELHCDTKRILNDGRNLLLLAVLSWFLPHVVEKWVHVTQHYCIAERILKWHPSPVFFLPRAVDRQTTGSQEKSTNRGKARGPRAKHERRVLQNRAQLRQHGCADSVKDARLSSNLDKYTLNKYEQIGSGWLRFGALGFQHV